MTKPSQGTVGNGLEGKARTTRAGTFLCWKLLGARGKGAWLVPCSFPVLETAGSEGKGCGWCLAVYALVYPSLEPKCNHLESLSSDWEKGTVNSQFL